MSAVPSPPPPSSKTLPVACRLVSTDQWLVTHLPRDKPVSVVKQTLLALFFSPIPAHERPPSPITFAPAFALHSDSRRSFDRQSRIVSLYDDDSYSLSDDLDYAATIADNSSTGSSPDERHIQVDAPLTAPPSPVPSHTSYLLLSFSTGLILEDHFSLEWYTIHPHELLELHPAFPGPIRLDRTGIRRYAEPYFVSRARIMRGGGGAAGGTEKGKETDRRDDKKDDKDDARRKTRRKRRKARTEWRERWVTICDGMLSLSKSPNSVPSTTIAPLCSLVTLRGPEHVGLHHSSNTPTTSSFDHFQLRNHPRSDIHSPPSLSPFTSLPSEPDARSYSNRSKEKEKRNTSPPPSPYIICAQFRTAPTDERPISSFSFPDTTTRVSSSASDARNASFDTNPSASWGPSTSAAAIAPGVMSASLGSAGTSWWRRGSRDASVATPVSNTMPGSPAAVGGNAGDFLPDVFGFGEMFGMRRGSSGTGAVPGGATGEEDTVWVVFDMLDERAHSHMLRILHLHASPSLVSSFMTFSPTPSSPASMTDVWEDKNYVFPSPEQDYVFPSQRASTSMSETAKTGSFPADEEQSVLTEETDYAAESVSSPIVFTSISARSLVSPLTSLSSASSVRTEHAASPTALSPASPVSPAASLALSVSSPISINSTSSSHTLVPASSPLYAQQQAGTRAARQPLPALVISTSTSTATAASTATVRTTARTLSSQSVPFASEGGEAKGRKSTGRRDVTGGYPGRRWAVVRRARRAGVGVLGRAMERVLFGVEQRGSDDRHKRKGKEKERVELRVVVGGMRQESGSDSDDDREEDAASSSDEHSDADSEGSWREWEGWRDDIRLRSTRATKAARHHSAEDEGEEEYGDEELSSDAEAFVPRGWAHGRLAHTADRARGSWISERSGEYVSELPAPASSYALSPSPATHARSLSTYASADSLLRRSVLTPTPIAVPAHRHTPHSHSMSNLRSASLALGLSHPHPRAGWEPGDEGARSRSPLCAEVSGGDHDRGPVVPKSDVRGEDEGGEEGTKMSRFLLGGRYSAGRERPRSVFSELEGLS